MCRIIAKQTMGMTLNLQNSQLMTFSSSTEEILSGTRPKTRKKFRSQPRETPLVPKPLKT